MTNQAMRVSAFAGMMALVTDGVNPLPLVIPTSL